MKFIDPNQDRWFAVEDGVSPQPAPHLLLDLAQWRAVREVWPAGVPVGVVLTNDVAVSEIAADLPALSLVVLKFPKWTDGRAYSQAHLLRARHRYAGEVRATGDVLVDMMPLLQRTGFDAALLRPGQSLDAARRALGFFPSYYQGDVHEPRPPLCARGDSMNAVISTRSAIALHARKTPGFDARVAHAVAVLRQAAAEHPGAIVQSTSLGVEGMVITDLIARHGINIRIATLDTGTLHAETTELIGRIEARYGLPVEVYRPVNESVVHFVGRNGSDAMYKSMALRKACCQIRKLEPMARMLEGPRRLGHGVAPRTIRASQRSLVPRDRRGRPREDHADRRLDRSRRVALRRGSRRTVQPAPRPVLPEHRLRAVHARGVAGRRFARRPLVVGRREPEGMRAARSQGRAASGRGMTAA